MVSFPARELLVRGSFSTIFQRIVLQFSHVPNARRVRRRRKKSYPTAPAWWNCSALIICRIAPLGWTQWIPMCRALGQWVKPWDIRLGSWKYGKIWKIHWKNDAFFGGNNGTYEIIEKLGSLQSMWHEQKLKLFFLMQGIGTHNYDVSSNSPRETKLGLALEITGSNRRI